VRFENIVNAISVRSNEFRCVGLETTKFLWPYIAVKWSKVKVSRLHMPININFLLTNLLTVLNLLTWQRHCLHAPYSTRLWLLFRRLYRTTCLQCYWKLKVTWEISSCSDSLKRRIFVSLSNICDVGLVSLFRDLAA